MMKLILSLMFLILTSNLFATTYFSQSNGVTAITIDLNATDDFTLSTMTILGATTMYNSLEILNQAGTNIFHVGQSGSIGIGGNITGTNKLDVTGNIGVTGTVDGVDISTLTVREGMLKMSNKFTGSTEFTDKVDVDDTATFGSSMTIAGNLGITGLINTNIQATGMFDVNGTSNFDSSGTYNSTLGILSGGGYFNSNLFEVGLGSFTIRANGDVETGGKLNLTGTSTFGSSVTVNGNIYQPKTYSNILSSTTLTDCFLKLNASNTTTSIYMIGGDSVYTGGNIFVFANGTAQMSLGQSIAFPPVKSDDLIFSGIKTGGWTEYMRLQIDTGFLGIGTTNPLQKLHVSGGNMRLDDGQFYGFYNGATLESYIQQTSNKFNFNNQQNGGYTFTTAGGGAALNILDSGYVGIGTTSPGTTLTVVGSISQPAGAYTTTLSTTTFTADNFVVQLSSTIITATDPGNAGTIRWDANYIYICTEANVWKRAALATWP